MDHGPKSQLYAKCITLNKMMSKELQHNKPQPAPVGPGGGVHSSPVRMREAGRGASLSLCWSHELLQDAPETLGPARLAVDLGQLLVCFGELARQRRLS